jgi:hypothetical protein
MSSTLFTTDSGDVIVRAGQEPGPKHDFRVHKFVLSLASPVFKDMFTFPQPPDQGHSEQSELPVVDVPDAPEVLDIILRFIYPGVEPPKFTDARLLSILLSAADKYQITSMWPVLRESLKSFIQAEPFRVYITACRFGFLEEAKVAAKVSTPSSYIGWDYEVEVRHISSTDLFRLVHFVQSRENAGRESIQDFVRWGPLRYNSGCNGSEEHWADVERFYSSLAKAVENAFVHNPCVEPKDLITVLHGMPDPPLCCQLPPSDPAIYEYADPREFTCPLQPTLIRYNLERLAKGLDTLSHEMLERLFEKGVESG